MAPTVFGEVQPSHVIALEEIFGPVLSLIEVEDEAEAFAVANNNAMARRRRSTPATLAGSSATSIKSKPASFTSNSATVGGEAQVPFGGLKDTGVGGREQGTTMLEFFTEWQSIYIDYTGSRRTASFTSRDGNRKGWAPRNCTKELHKKLHR